MSKTISDTRVAKQKALLVGVQLPRVSDDEMRDSLAELKRLVDTLGYVVIGSMNQRRNGTGSSVVLGEGKLRDLARWTGGTGVVAAFVQPKKSKASERFEKTDDDVDEDVDVEAEIADEPEESESLDLDTPTELADVVVFDCELTPSQMRNLESATGAKVLDRTGVIIEIFSRHARTKAARLQVEIARLKYVAPRLRETGASADKQMGGGGKGAGETSLELDRRKIRDRIKELKDELENVQRDSQTRRTRRSDENCVALIGYTNAGKSSLMRAMTGSEILVADQLFATLETTVRPIYPPTMPKVLLSDTVGFIKKLPHDLVASFRSTLDEALNADLLLFVVDAADPAFRSHLEVTNTVITEIGATEIPRRVLLNKKDRLSPTELSALKTEFPEAIFISTRDAADLEHLRGNLLAFFESDMLEETLVVPYSMQGAVGEIRRNMRVVEETFHADGVHFKVKVRPEVLERFRRDFNADPDS